MKHYLFLMFAPILAWGETGILFDIVDGDTVEFNRGKVKCRMAFIDTPESRRNRKAKKDVAQCDGLTLNTMVKAGKAATKHAGTLLKVGKKYQYEVTSTDRYGRSICIVKLQKSTYNKTMIADGYALPYRQYIDKSNRRMFDRIARKAKQEKQGLWKTMPAVMKCLNHY